jgi:hypothetical protein
LRIQLFRCTTWMSACRAAPERPCTTAGRKRFSWT